MSKEESNPVISQQLHKKGSIAVQICTSAAPLGGWGVYPAVGLGIGVEKIWDLRGGGLLVVGRVE